MCHGSWICLWTVISSFCSMSRLSSCILLRKITKHTNLSYLSIIKTSIRKLNFQRPTVSWKLFCGRFNNALGKRKDGKSRNTIYQTILLLNQRMKSSKIFSKDTAALEITQNLTKSAFPTDKKSILSISVQIEESETN